LNFSDTINDAEIFRLDAEHYKKEYLEIKRILGNHECALLSELVVQTISTGHTPSMANEKFYGGNVKFIKTDNLRDNFIKPEFNHYLSDLGNQEIKRTQLQVNDIIVTIIGATQAIIGRATKINEEILPANINQNIALIRVNSKKIVPDYVNIYLNSFYGRNYLYYLSRQTEQVNLNCEELGRLQVPIFSNEFQMNIETLVKSVHQKLEESKKLYSEAEGLLLEELELNDFTPSNECVAVKSFSESFGMSGRLDAEYYQLKYDDIIGRIKSYHGGYKKLGAITTLKKSIEPGSEAYGDEGVQFLRVADLFKYELKEPEIRLSESLFDAEKLNELKPKKGEVLLSKDGSVGIAYAVREDTNFIPSGAIVRLQQITDILPDVLALILNSQVVQLQAERDAGGSILQHWKPSEINEVLVPLLNEKVQKMIAEKISESFTLRTESKRLLEEEKTAVERAIEQGEYNE
jgi:restriction endonuclease S subunit